MPHSVLEGSAQRTVPISSLTRRLSVLAALAILCWSAAAMACSVCGCGDPLVEAGDSMPVRNGFRFALDYDYLSATARSDDEPDKTESLTQQTVRPVLVYSPTDRLNVVAQIPFSRKDWSLSGGGESPKAAQPTGLGDIDLGVRYFVWEATNLRALRRENVAITAGTSLPTGANDYRLDGQRIDEHAQVGTGAWGPYLGLLYAFHQDPWNFFVDLSGRIRTRNSFGYKYGDALLWSLRTRYRLVERLAFQLGVDGRYAARDRSNDVLQVNTGGLVLSAVPGVAWNAFDRFWMLGQVQVPFFTHLFGQQTVGATVTVTLQYVLG